MTIGKIILPTQQSWRTFPLLNSLGAELSFPALSDFSPDGIPNMTIRLDRFLRFDGFFRLAFQKSVNDELDEQNQCYTSAIQVDPSKWLGDSPETSLFYKEKFEDFKKNHTPTLRSETRIISQRPAE
ncbi:hypothetical protein AVEN_70797-1 [Araneus ventricosus]|uniref:Uncharacterized protein n=1 Tax=Araneus ventricosus TaxID=182803 RepID=A0A4Y2R0Z4_ARAVE|nr:hypothetical protein AVEN_70797-1 [Araneus ventricosus]